jgi:hypothetical protein
MSQNRALPNWDGCHLIGEKALDPKNWGDRNAGERRHGTKRNLHDARVIAFLGANMAEVSKGS